MYVCIKYFIQEREKGKGGEGRGGKWVPFIALIDSTSSHLFLQEIH